jgi:hypothetical protein
MDDIIEPTMDYDFEKLYFGPPTTLAGGAYFSRLMYKTNKTLFIQCPKSLTKQGFVKSGKKVYTDLMFDNNDTVFINWIENLEIKCQNLVFLKRDSWFKSQLEKDDIESAFTSPFKIFKSGKYYLLRVNVNPNIKIYNEKDQIITSEELTNDKTIISILEIQGLKFTSRNFQIEIELKQAMVVRPDPFLDECFIKKPLKSQSTKEVMMNELNETNELNKLNEDIDLDTLGNLDNLINQSVADLSKNSKNKTNDIKSIDLDVSFDEPNKENPFDLEEANIVLDIEELDINEEIKEDPSILKEIDLSSTLDNNLEAITLKKPNQVYYEIYQKAREKAKDAKKNAITAYLEMKNIKKTYMLDDIDESDNEFDEFESRDSSSEISDSESLEDNF